MAKVHKKQALGRGLSALLNDSKKDIKSTNDQHADKIVGNVLDLPLEVIDMNPYQPRTSFNETHLKELASSIKELGVIQPITVRRKNDNRFELVSGERRCRASKMAGLKVIPAYIRLADDQESLEMALVENIQREDLDPIEIALSYKRLIEEIDLTQEQMSERVGKSRSTIANHLRLLKLDPIIQTGMRDGFISMGHGRALITLPSQNDQVTVYQQVLGENLSVRQTEELVRISKNGEQSDSPLSRKRNSTPTLPDYLSQATKKLSLATGRRISAKVSKNGKGSINIPFDSEADLQDVLNLLNAQ